MKLHREGYIIMITTFLILVGINALVYKFIPSGVVLGITVVITTVIMFLVMQFFRVPRRDVTLDETVVVCPSDGKVVVIEEVTEPEYFKDKRIQISIFMSPLNVHVNWYPISGIVKYFKYHKGKYLVAWHPKSSTDNERTTVVVENSLGVGVLFRQIAGAVARRIVCYATPGTEVTQSTEFGFIKFGSRIDIFLPVGSKIKVNLEDKVVGSKTILAVLPQPA